MTFDGTFEMQVAQTRKVEALERTCVTPGGVRRRKAVSVTKTGGAKRLKSGYSTGLRRNKPREWTQVVDFPHLTEK